MAKRISFRSSLRIHGSHATIKVAATTPKGTKTSVKTVKLK